MNFPASFTNTEHARLLLSNIVSSRALIRICMAFFNLTYLGPQDPIKDTCAAQTKEDKSIEKKPVDNSATVSTQADSTQPSQGTTSGNGKPVDPSRAHHGGSHVKHTELMHKHTRHPLGECVSVNLQ